MSFQKFQPKQEFTDAIAAQFWTNLSPAARHALGLEAVLEAVWQDGDHKLPTHPNLWEIWRTRLIVSPVIHSAKPRHVLLRELMSRPGQPVMVSDSQLPGASSLHYCVSLDDLEEIPTLLRRQFASKAVIRQYDERYLFAAPVSSFFNNNAQ